MKFSGPFAGIAYTIWVFWLAVDKRFSLRRRQGEQRSRKSGAEGTFFDT
jgi:hypothetical protein